MKAINNYIPFFISLYIKIFAYIYEKISKMLTDNENHQKQGQYDNSYIIKNFIFGVVNEYYTFYYIIFYLAREKCQFKNKTCLEFLTSQLRIIFYTNLTINLLKEIIKP